MSTDSMILREALQYAGLGWKVIPLYGITEARACECSKGADCPSAGKHPRIKSWQTEATDDMEKIAEWFRRWPNSNVGVALGKGSGIVDFECDSEDAEKSLLSLFGGMFPETPTFISSRGKHRLFRWTDELPNINQATFRVGEIDFKVGGGEKGSQSVFPPSRRRDGASYQWLIHPSRGDVAEIAPDTLARIWNHQGGLFGERVSGGERKPPEHWEQIFGGVDTGHRNQAAAELVGRLLADLRDPFDNAAAARVWLMVQAWNVQNRPPIEEKELRTTFESILRLHREGRTKEEYEAAVEKYVDRCSDSGKPSAAKWRLVLLLAQPARWKLFSPLWEFSAPGGFLSLSSEQILSYRQIQIQALEQSHVWLGPDFKTLWMGTKKEEGMGSKLTKMAETEEPWPEERRDAVVADIAMTVLEKSRQAETPHNSGQPTKLHDGRILFKVAALVRRMNEVMEGIAFGEVAALMRAVGATDEVIRMEGGVFRFKSLSGENLTAIRRVAFSPVAPLRVAPLVGEFFEGEKNLKISATAQHSSQAQTDK